MAAKHGSINVLTKLIVMGVSLDVPNRACRTPLLLSVSALLNATGAAARNTYFNTLNYLMQQKVNINATSFIGDTALHLATREEDEHVARLPLASGANVNEFTSPLVWARCIWFVVFWTAPPIQTS